MKPLYETKDSPLHAFLGAGIEKLVEDVRDAEDPSSRKRYEEGAPNEHDRDIDQIIGNRLIFEGLKLLTKYMVDRGPLRVRHYAEQAVARVLPLLRGVPEAGDPGHTPRREPPALNGPRSDE